MKITNALLPFVLCGIIFVNINCKKEVPDANIVTPDTNPIINPPPQLPVNTAPVANAGEDQTIFLPTNFTLLRGSVYDKENNIKTILWRKIAGPSGDEIETPDSLATKVNHLEKGIYLFELTVTDSAGLKGMDTCTVLVSEIIINPPGIMLENLTWISPWYNSLEIKNFKNLVPPGTQFKIYIQRDANPNWIEVPSILANVINTKYEYFIETRTDGAGMYNYGSLYIFYYGNDVSDRPVVRIEF